MIDYVVNTINSDPVMEVEYYEIVDGNTLESIKNWSDTDYPVGCITGILRRGTFDRQYQILIISHTCL